MTEEKQAAATPPLPGDGSQFRQLEPVDNGEEPFYFSVRFYVSVLTPLIAGIVTAYGDAIPWLKSLSQEELAIWIAGLIVTAVSFVIGRTVRNIDVSGGLAIIRAPGRFPAIPGRIVGTRIVKSTPEGVATGGPKEPLLTSKRFWATVLTPVTAALLASLAKTVPEAGQLDPALVTSLLLSVFLSGSAYVLARSFRNTKITANR